MGNNQKGFLLYLDNYDLIEDLSREEKGDWIEAIFHYKREGKIPDFTKGTLLNTAFKVTKNQLDRDEEKYQETCKERAEAGRKGGLAKARNAKQSKAKASNRKQDVANLADNDTDNDTVTDNVIDTENDIVSDTETEQADADPVPADQLAASAAADAEPPAGDLFSVEQLLAIVKKNKVKLTEEGVQTFHDEMHESGWILYQQPVEKKGIVKALRGWAKYHLEYGIEENVPSMPDKCRKYLKEWLEWRLIRDDDDDYFEINNCEYLRSAIFENEDPHETITSMRKRIKKEYEEGFDLLCSEWRKAKKVKK